jgi:ComF family protein
VWITTNYAGAARDLIKVYKFGHQRAAARSLSQLMVETLHDFNNLAELAKLNYLIVPVPTATSRIRQRGFDHSALLAMTLARRMETKSTNVLGRLGQTRQLGAKRTDRLSQSEGNYFVRLPQITKGRNVLLTDDVVTTGATLKAITKVLRAAGAKRVDALVFAKRL